MHAPRLPVALAASLLLALLAPLAAPAAPAAPAESGVRPFARHAQFQSAKLSPKGTYLAAIATEDGKRSLAFVNLATRKIASVLRPGGETMVGNYHWVNDERVVVELVDQDGDLDQPRSRGELYAVDATGRGGRLVFGYRAGEQQVGSHIRRGERARAGAFVVGTIPGDDRHVLVRVFSFDEEDAPPSLVKLDVYSGVTDDVSRAPIRGGHFIVDERGAPRIAFGLDEQVKERFFYRDPDAGWRPLTAVKGFGKDSDAWAFSARDRTVYVADPAGGEYGLYGVAIDTGERKLLFRGKVAPLDVVLDRATHHVLAVESEPDLPAYDFVEPEHPLCRALKGLLAAYPGAHVRLLSTTADQKKAVVIVYADRDPGQFLVVDVDKLTAEPVVAARPWIDPEAMAEESAFHIAASDGFGIHGYFTLPRAPASGAAPPLVVLPHGGPHFVRDTWSFDPEAQLLASQGFAVLQVNYRGSGGYGTAYQEAGYRRWGDRVVQDVVDATRWAIGKGFGDPRRVCIYGASFGAFAALQAAALAPDLFRCAVGYAGVYDLTLLARTGDIRETRSGRGYVRTVLGDDDGALRKASPVYAADRIRARVLLVHGAKDERAPIEHAERMRKALEAAGRPPQWLVEPREAHGFYDEGARVRMYERVVAFLKEGAAAPPAAKAP